MTTRAALYARFSTEKQSEASIEDQLRVCERIAERERFEIVARFSDAAISGGTTQRPGYQSMLAAARRREFDIIVAEDTSRLWRNLAEQAPRLAELADIGAQVVTHDLDTRQESAGLLGAVLGASAEAYRREISRRTRRGLEGRALKGEPTGGRAYGYRSAKEIDEGEAAIVRRIFELYADGISPRGIAAQLNEEGVPSPGAHWKRAARRKDSKWLASAIHGQVERGTGILNNRRYAGVVAWGRFAWKRSAADSSKRTPTLNAAAHERLDESLRIVSDELWARVKARQTRQGATLGQRVKGALRKRRPGGGPPSRYLLSGLLRCGACEASFVLSNGARYQCASHVNGAACEVSQSVPRERVERLVLDCVETDLFDPAKLGAFEQRYRAAASRPAADPAPRLATLEQEIRNLADAIAKGLLSDALASRLKAAEAERTRLVAASARPPGVARTLAPATTERRIAIMRQRLAEGGEIARGVVQELCPQSIWLRPDAGGRHLWAEFEADLLPLFDMDIAAMFPLDPPDESVIMVAGARFAYCRLSLAA